MKLKLNKLPHTNPYKVTQLNKGKNVLFNKKEWVGFTIGKYQGKNMCDVVPMDACHLLLDRPWKYDKDIVHHGKKNMYAFKKDGITYELQ